MNVNKYISDPNANAHSIDIDTDIDPDEETISTDAIRKPDHIIIDHPDISDLDDDDDDVDDNDDDDDDDIDAVEKFNRFYRDLPRPQYRRLPDRLSASTIISNITNITNITNTNTTNQSDHIIGNIHFADTDTDTDTDSNTTYYDNSGIMRLISDTQLIPLHSASLVVDEIPLRSPNNIVSQRRKFYRSITINNNNNSNQDHVSSTMPTASTTIPSVLESGIVPLSRSFNTEEEKK